MYFSKTSDSSRVQRDEPTLTEFRIPDPEAVGSDVFKPQIQRFGNPHACDRQQSKNSAAGAYAVDALALDIALAAEVAVGALGRDHGIQPLLGALNDRLVLKNVAEIDVATQPVRYFFPSELTVARGAGPFLAVEFAELADLFELAGEAS